MKKGTTGPPTKQPPVKKPFNAEEFVRWDLPLE